MLKTCCSLVDLLYKSRAEVVFSCGLVGVKQNIFHQLFLEAQQNPLFFRLYSHKALEDFSTAKPSVGLDFYTLSTNPTSTKTYISNLNKGALS